MPSSASLYARRFVISAALTLLVATLARAATLPNDAAAAAAAEAAAASARSAPVAVPSTDTPATPDDQAVLEQVLDGRLPGDQTNASLRRALTSPSAESRWRGLPLFGRDLFHPGSEAMFAPLENAPVSPDYVLGPGDNLLAFISSLRDTVLQLTIDREGKVFLPQVGSTFLWGLRFDDAESLIRARLATVLRSARVHVSMGRVRALDVFVVGAVRAPGKYTLT